MVRTQRQGESVSHNLRAPTCLAHDTAAPKDPQLPALPPAGRWHTQDFFAAVATADDLLAQADPRAALVGVIDAAFEASRGWLEGK